MASDDRYRRLIEEIEKIRKQIRNSKLKVKRRIKNLEKTLDPLEKQRMEIEIELLKKKIFGLHLEESKISLSITQTMIKHSERDPSIDGIDRSKAGKA